MNLLESTSVHDFELVVSRDLVYKNHTWIGQANVIYQGRCIGCVGLHTKEQFLRETHLCCEGRFTRYKDKDFSEEQFKRGVLGSIQVTKVNSKTYEEGIVGEVAQFRENCISQLQPELSFGRALAACGLCAYRPSLYSFNIPRIFMRCGLMHLIAISSCHIVILSAYIDALFKKLTLKPLLRGVLNLFLLSSYALFCGVPASALRAILLVEQKYIMQCVGRKNHTLSAVSIVALLMLCVDPQLSVNIAFTLSLTCILGMNIYGGLAQYYAKTAFHLSGYGAVQKVLRKPFSSVRNTMCATTVAQFSCLPISCVCFGHFSLLAPLSSALITSPFSLLSLFGIGAIILSSIKPAQDTVLFFIDFLGKLIETLASFLSERPFASVFVADIGWIVSLAFIAVMVALYVLWPKGR
ncbi:MAG: ComEC/Rec2 family competence protein, partial [Atopobium sp.]|nr:ComEC/Rec2 family competence protein [Atopobium sp.]